MGFVGSIFSGSQGAGFQASSAPIQQGVNQNQINQGYQSTQSGLAQQQALVNALAAQNGIQNQSSVFNQQQALANQLQAGAMGQGPNPVLAQLHQATGQNVANQSALMGSQRGVSANAGLLAREAAQQGAAVQQNAVGQASALQAQQQMAYQQALQNQQSQMAGLATQQVGQQQGAIGTYNQAAQNQYQALLNAQAQYNNAQVGMQSNVNSANAAIASENAKTQAGLLGGGFQAAGASGVLGGGIQKAAGAAHGGMIGYANGGSVSSGPQSMAGRFLTMNQGGNIPRYNFTPGGTLPGNPKVNQDTIKNDVVPIWGSPGEIMLPLSITRSSNPPEKAKEFVSNELKKRAA